MQCPRCQHPNPTGSSGDCSRSEASRNGRGSGVPHESAMAYGGPRSTASRRKITVVPGNRGCCFDVYAWRDDSVLFAEVKLSGKDRVNVVGCLLITAAETYEQDTRTSVGTTLSQPFLIDSPPSAQASFGESWSCDG